MHCPFGLLQVHPFFRIWLEDGKILHLSAAAQKNTFQKSLEYYLQPRL